MIDLISREEFERRIKPYDTDDPMDKALYNFAHNKMTDCPSAELERKRGYWTNHGDCWECGVCHEVISEEHFPTTKYLAPIYNFCPICGADMKGV